jgi:hypothetical protein
MNLFTSGEAADPYPLGCKPHGRGNRIWHIPLLKRGGRNNSIMQMPSAIRLTLPYVEIAFRRLKS